MKENQFDLDMKLVGPAKLSLLTSQFKISLEKAWFKVKLLVI
jgi:hypothetical protein